MIKLSEVMKKKNALLILLIVGVLLIVIAIPTGGSDKKEDEKAESNVLTDYDYASAMEERLEGFLSQISGVGKVQVLISWKGSSEKLVEKDENETVYYNRLGGEQEPFIRQQLLPKAEGVVVIAEGGDNAVVVTQITEAVRALFGVDTHKIKIMKGG